jgi:predicted ArsR family transcriptional regulator
MSPVTPDDVVTALIEADKSALTRAEVGEALDVVHTTVRNYADELENDPRIERDKAGRAEIWYLKESARFPGVRRDQRIQEARRAVANDHNMEPEEVSLEALLKITCGAYCGYQQTSDWRPENDSSGGFKESAKAMGQTHD